MKLLLKKRDGSTLYRKYDTPQTPLQRLLATDILGDEAKARLLEISQALDPVQLLNQLVVLQNSLWKQAVLRGKTEPVTEPLLVPVPVLADEAVKLLPSTNEEAVTNQVVKEPIKQKIKIKEVRFEIVS